MNLLACNHAKRGLAMVATLVGRIGSAAYSASAIGLRSPGLIEPHS